MMHSVCCSTKSQMPFWELEGNNSARGMSCIHPRISIEGVFTAFLHHAHLVCLLYISRLENNKASSIALFAAQALQTWHVATKGIKQMIVWAFFVFPGLRSRSQLVSINPLSLVNNFPQFIEGDILPPPSCFWPCKMWAGRHLRLQMWDKSETFLNVDGCVSSPLTQTPSLCRPILMKLCANQTSAW